MKKIEIVNFATRKDKNVTDVICAKSLNFWLQNKIQMI